MNSSVNKRFEFLDSIEDSLDLHPVPFSDLMVGRTSIFSESGQDAPPPIFLNAYLLYGQSDIFLPTNFPEEPKYLSDQGTPIGNNDTMIAGHAVSEGCILVTNNRKEFDRVPDLEVEDWSVI